MSFPTKSCIVFETFLNSDGTPTLVGLMWIKKF